jgi:hypothetical protein
METTSKLWDLGRHAEYKSLYKFWLLGHPTGVSNQVNHRHPSVLTHDILPKSLWI